MPTNLVTLAFLLSSLTHSIKVISILEALSFVSGLPKRRFFLNCTMCLFTASETKGAIGPLDP